MRRGKTALAGSVVATALWLGTAAAIDAPPPPAMTRAPVALASVGPLTFSDDGTLFLGDSYGAAVYAIDLEEQRVRRSGAVSVRGLDARVASLLGASRDDVRLHDIAVSPVSRDVYVTVTRAPADDSPIKNGLHAGGTPHLLRVTADGSITEVDLGSVLHQRADIRDVRSEAENDRWGQDRRAWNILEMSFVDGTLYLSGLSNEEWSAKLRRLPYPFDGAAPESTAFRIFHTAHGRYETGAPARVFVPYEHDGETRIFAGFSCTPLVDLSVAEMEEARRVEGKTIAELGAGNHVLDMIGIERDGETYFLLANHLHDFMRLKRSDFDGATSLTRPTNRAGIERSPLRHLDGVTRLASDRDERIVVLQERDGGLDLRSLQVEDFLR